MSRSPSTEGPRRFLPHPGRRLTVANIHGAWRPSGAVAGVGVFAVVWATRQGTWWAPLHDFEPADQLRLIDDCRRLEKVAGFRGAWPEGRSE